MRFLVRVPECEAEVVELGGQLMAACLIGGEAKLLPWKAFDAVFKQKESEPLSLAEAHSPSASKRSEYAVMRSIQLLSRSGTMATLDEIADMTLAAPEKVQAVLDCLRLKGRVEPVYAKTGLAYVPNTPIPADDVVRWRITEGA